jgi:hypothetical protein
MRLRLTPAGCLVALFAGSAGALLGVIIGRGHVKGTRLLLIWVGCVLPTLLVGAWIAGRGSHRS